MTINGKNLLIFCDYNIYITLDVAQNRIKKGSGYRLSFAYCILDNVDKLGKL